jgi:hypothetical protein
VKDLAENGFVDKPSRLEATHVKARIYELSDEFLARASEVVFTAVFEPVPREVREAPRKGESLGLAAGDFEWAIELREGATSLRRPDPRIFCPSILASGGYGLGDHFTWQTTK